MTVDDELRAIAEKSASQYPDSFLTAQGWTRTELIDAIHARLRNKYTEMRDEGRLYRDGTGQIRHIDDECPTPAKRRYRNDKTAARYAKRHPIPDTLLWPYLCPTGHHWHLTS